MYITQEVAPEFTRGDSAQYQSGIADFNQVYLEMDFSCPLMDNIFANGVAMTSMVQ